MTLRILVPAMTLACAAWLAPCAANNAQKNSAAARLVAWTVPSSDLRVGVPFALQARLTPLGPLPGARMRVDVAETDFRVQGPASFELGDLVPPKTPPASKPNTPPALGMTVLRKFTLVPLKTGRLTARVLVASGAIEARFDKLIEVVATDR